MLYALAAQQEYDAAPDIALHYTATGAIRPATRETTGAERPHCYDRSAVGSYQKWALGAKHRPAVRDLPIQPDLPRLKIPSAECITLSSSKSGYRYAEVDYDPRNHRDPPG